MTAARTAEYCDLAAAASAAADDDTASRRRTLHRLRRELRRIARRDYFAAAGRDTARATLEELGERDARRDDVATRGGG
jgi:hypothetical protein